jgi:hypothetical protein
MSSYPLLTSQMCLETVQGLIVIYLVACFVVLHPIILCHPPPYCRYKNNSIMVIISQCIYIIKVWKYMQKPLLSLPCSKLIVVIIAQHHNSVSTNAINSATSMYLHCTYSRWPEWISLQFGPYNITSCMLSWHDV